MSTQTLDTPSLPGDYLIVALLSSGLAEILNRRQGASRGETNRDGLLPAAWRMGFSRLWLKCLAHGHLPDWSDLDLMALCGRPLRTWPVPLDLSAADLQHPLVADHHLSPFAEQAARFAGRDVEANWTEHLVYRQLIDAASANGRTESERDETYAYLRRFLIDHAVVDDVQVLALEHRFGARDDSGQTYVRKLIQAAYDERPATGRQRFQLCARCGNVVTGRRASCGTAGCEKGTSRRTVYLNPLAVVYEQNRATRRYIHDPGQVEARILDALGSEDLTRRIRVTPYPRLDMLDVLVEFLDQGSPEPRVVETWGIDAKDQVSARLLGESFTWPSDARCDRRILALPTHRSRDPEYEADLRAALEGRAYRVDIVAEDRLLREVRKRAKELSR